MLPRSDNRPSFWPILSGLFLASGYLLLGLQRPVYAAAFSVLIVSFAVAVLLRRTERISSGPSRSRAEREPASALATYAGLCCFAGFVLLLIAQAATTIVESLYGTPLESERFSQFNIDLNISVPISNLLLIFAGYRILSQYIYIKKFLSVYFISTSSIWHFAFLTWNINPNAALFYYSEWSRNTFSGPVFNGNHAAVVTLVIFAYFLLRCREHASFSQNSESQSTRPAPFVICALQAAIFFYYTVHANSLMVNATLFAAVILLIAFMGYSTRSRLLYLTSAVAALGIAMAYTLAIIMLDPTQISLFGFEARQIIGREALHLILDRPLFGYGTGSEYLALLGRSMTAIPELIFQSAHSYYLDFLLQYGFVGFLLAFTGIFIVPMSVWIRRGSREKFMSSTAFLIWILWLVLLLTALTDFALSIPSISMLLCFLTGGIYRQFVLSRKDGAPREQDVPGSSALPG